MNKEKAMAVTKEKIAESLGLDVVEAAAGIKELIDIKMRDATMGMVMSRGYDISEYYLLGIGGGGPTHIAGYSEGVPLKGVMAFPYSAVFSAFGASSADYRHNFTLATNVVIPPMADDAAKIAGGLDQYGRPFGAMNFEAMCCGMGSMAFMDGLNCCYAAPNSEGDFSDVEVWEKIMPQLWLGRRIHMDGGGHGKYQGGGGIASLYLQEHSEHCEIGGTGPFYKVFSIHGLMGAYPAPCCYHWYATNTNVQACIDNKRPLPYFGGENPAEPQWADLIQAENLLLPAQVVSRPVKKHDLWQQFANGGGGIGDPIERDPQDGEIFVGPQGADPDWMIMREFYCPDCAALLDVECVVPGHPIVFNQIPDIDGFYDQRPELKKRIFEE